MTPRDTTPLAHEAQVAAARRLGTVGRLRVAAEMSEAMRHISIDGMRRRHPEYSEEQARTAVLCLVWGEPLATLVGGASVNGASATTNR